MQLVDWRDPSVPDLSGVWRAEAERWREQLAWDSDANWDAVEQQRRSGHLPGLVLLDGPTIAGWTFFLSRHDTLQIGGLGSRSEAATRALLDAVVSVAEPAFARDGLMLFAFSDAPGLAEGLTLQQFEQEPYLYLTRELRGAFTIGGGLEWSAIAEGQLPSLFAGAYGTPGLTRPFVRHGHPFEWQEYVAQLVRLNACGQFQPDLSAASLASDETLQGATLVTAIHPRTAHVAQVSVHPGCQGRGLAEAMLRQVMSKAQRRGFERMSLLVGERNLRARDLYGKLGFSEVARFTSAGRAAYPRRSTSPAAETGGASTFR